MCGRQDHPPLRPSLLGYPGPSKFSSKEFKPELKSWNSWAWCPDHVSVLITQSHQLEAYYLVGWWLLTGEGVHVIYISIYRWKLCVISLGRRESRSQQTFQQHPFPGEPRGLGCDSWCRLPCSGPALPFLSKLRCLQSYLRPHHLPGRHSTTLSEIFEPKNIFAPASLQLWIGRSWGHKFEPSSHLL